MSMSRSRLAQVTSKRTLPSSESRPGAVCRPEEDVERRAREGGSGDSTAPLGSGRAHELGDQCAHGISEERRSGELFGRFLTARFTAADFRCVGRSATGEPARKRARARWRPERGSPYRSTLPVFESAGKSFPLGANYYYLPTRCEMPQYEFRALLPGDPALVARRIGPESPPEHRPRSRTPAATGTAPRP